MRKITSFWNGVQTSGQARKPDDDSSTVEPLILRKAERRARSRLRLALSALPLSFLILWTGCSQTTLTHPLRSGSEQLLLSTAADRAISHISLDALRGKRVFVDGSYLEGYDSKYVLGSLREAVSRAGGLLQSDLARSEIVVEVRVGAMSIDPSDSLVGIPKTGLPLPLAGAIETPEVALYKTSRHNSITKIALFAYSSDSKAYFFGSGPAVGKGYVRYYKLLGLIQWVATDVPDLKKK